MQRIKRSKRKYKIGQIGHPKKDKIGRIGYTKKERYNSSVFRT